MRSIALSIAIAIATTTLVGPQQGAGQAPGNSTTPRTACPVHTGMGGFTLDQAEPRGPLGYDRQQFVVAPMIPYAMNHYVPYGLPRAVARAMDRLNVDVLRKFGSFQGVPFYADPTTRRAPEFLFILDDTTCQLQAYQELSCVAMATPSLFITVLDAAGGPPKATPRVEVRDDRGFEEVKVTAEFRGVVERPGAYDVMIEATGYHPWRASNIVVPPGGCGGQMVLITAYLNPDRD